MCQIRRSGAGMSPTDMELTQSVKEVHQESAATVPSWNDLD
jgi:hypothetical protein